MQIREEYYFCSFNCYHEEGNEDSSRTILERGGASADDPDRKQKVQHFRDYVYDVLVTTTILERGVTIPNVQVGVLGSESTIFTESALVQISGRVGRHPDYCTGDVFLFHFGLTRSMKQAKKHIAK